MSRVCFLEDMAKTWPAYNKWQFNGAGKAYLSTTIGEIDVPVFQDDNHVKASIYTEDTFLQKFDMSYSEFIDQMVSGMVMRSS